MTILSRVALESSKRLIRPILCKSSETSFIKPASPTPPHLGRYNLSSSDINNHNYYIPLVLFYSGSEVTADRSLISSGLKRSLSQTLTKYYPFAGRLRTSEAYVDCCDQGVEFLEAQVKCKLDELIHGDKDYEDEYDRVAHLFPPGSVWGEPRNNSSSNSGGPPLIVQLNRFECGGMALAVCITHRITDGCGSLSFLKHWAAVSRQSGAQVDDPHLVSWPAQNNVDVLSNIPYMNRSRRNWITKRFVFQNSSIARLKKTVVSRGVENPTSVELVSALLYKTALNSASSFSPSILLMMANVRAKLLLPENAVGNFFWSFRIEAREQGDVTLHKLIERCKYGKMQLRNMEMKDMEGERLKAELSVYEEGDMDFTYLCSSFCNYPLYNIDFGWGKPIKIRLADTENTNGFLLMDTLHGDGIEAMVSLGEEHMSRFLSDQHIITAAAAERYRYE